MDRVLVGAQEREVDEDTLMQFEKGYLWEETLSQAFGEKAPRRIGEVALDGIVMSPDGVCSGGFQELIIEEYKCTALSPDKSPTENWKWMMQVKGYCKAVRATKCIFRILHHVAIMHSPEDAYAVWELVFTQAELDENWQAVLNHAKTMKEE